MIVYVETSALTPLIKKEDTSLTIRDYLGDLVEDGHLLLTGRLTETELRRAAHGWGAPQAQATIVLEALAIEEQTPSHFKIAGTIGSKNLRSLDALHVATAVAAGCSAMITLDARVAEASEGVGVPVLDLRRPVERAGYESGSGSARFRDLVPEQGSSDETALEALMLTRGDR